MIRVGSIVLRVDDLARQARFWTAALDADDQAAEVRRLLALGATEVQWDKRPADADYVILADPEGNRFCVVDAG